ncbi:MAG: hypothetical protein ACXAD7_24150 [Candidatus Kariarchaeaceae archaeon]
MVLGFTLVNNDGFCVFEHFLTDFYAYGISKTELFTQIESMEPNETRVIKTIKLSSIRIEEDIALVLILSENSHLSEETNQKFSQLAGKVAAGDNIAIRRVLQAKSLHEFISA